MKSAYNEQNCSSLIVTERDIWTIAGMMVREFGDHAVIEASIRADTAMSDSDLENHGLWRRVIGAIAALTETEAETLH